MSYTALRSMKVQTAAGKIEIRGPGDKVPEASTWPNVHLYVKRGYISPDDAATAKASIYDRSKIIPNRAADVSVKNASAKPVQANPTGNSSEFDELMKMSRKDLNDYAQSRGGIDNPDKYPTKKPLIRDILENLGA